MRKILSVMAVILAVVAFSSCNSFEQKAKKQMYKTLKEVVKNPASLKISDEKVIIGNDSLCIIHFLASNNNNFGAEISTYMEYIYVKEKDKSILERVSILDSSEDKNRSFESMYKKMLSSKDELITGAKEKGISHEDAAARIMYDFALLDCNINGGRKVTE